VLEVRALSFGFPGRTIGRDVSFSLAAGESMCVLGPNGGGKTTLFRTILGLLPVKSGEVRLNERPLHLLDRAEIARDPVERTEHATSDASVHGLP